MEKMQNVKIFASEAERNQITLAAVECAAISIFEILHTGALLVSFGHERKFEHLSDLLKNPMEQKPGV